MEQIIIWDNNEERSLRRSTLESLDDLNSKASIFCIKWESEILNSLTSLKSRCLNEKPGDGIVVLLTYETCNRSLEQFVDYHVIDFITSVLNKTICYLIKLLNLIFHMVWINSCMYIIANYQNINVKK